VANATPNVRVVPIEWTIVPPDSLPVTLGSLSELDEWFADHPEVDSVTVPLYRNRKRLYGALAPHPTLW
jgi:hypothetical protein